jgi:aspartyl-tRNA(Asn)/glutamyl-tRNA(Gln) amidotransferase subunit A
MKPADLTLTEQAAALADGRFRSRDLVEDSLERIARWQPLVNAWVDVYAGPARAAADRADRDRTRRARLGPLHGVPLAHKDMFHRPDRRPGMGSRVPMPGDGTTSTLLERLATAGAFELGALNMAEFALGPTGHNACTGAVRNPWNCAHVSGGSSSGGGVAVATRTVAASVGSDTGGSVRLPAGATGVLGLKPTYGRVTRAGMMPLSPSVDVAGLFARSVPDLALLLGLVAGHDDRDPASSRRPVPDYARALGSGIADLRIGVPTQPAFAPVDPGVTRAFEAAIDGLARLGVQVVPVTLPAPEPLTELSRALVYAEAWAIHREWMRDHSDGYTPQVRVRAATGLGIADAAYAEAQRLRPALLRRWVEEVYAHCDVLMLPTLAIEVPTLAETDVGGGAGMWTKIAAMVPCTAPFNYLGLPALAVPCGFGATGLPVSFQLAGRPFDEATLLRVADAYQRATDWHQRAPSPESAAIAAAS